MFQKILHTLEMVKFSHSIFALPFALSSMVVAARGLPSPKILFLIVMAMVTARNTAMSMNRWIDRDIDGKNPRTQNRHLPQKLLTPRYVLIFALSNALLFVTLCLFINRLAFFLSLPTLLVLVAYSWIKRFSSLTQIYLGLCLGMAPLGAWIAVTGNLAWPPVFLGMAVLFWVAGFDILYAIQDHEFDKGHNLYSLVVSLGIPKALLLSRLFHLMTLGLLLGFGSAAGLDLVYNIGCLFVAVLLTWEHSLIRPSDLSRINIAFFNFNGVIGLVFLAGVCVDVLMKPIVAFVLQ
ncbi:MAG: hypothetical protein A3I75_07600 [Deltaproteobacteria bacterium RIFCSPLOWO2_02_FULL_50_16]|nr:MAG: hypothetical protein A3I75_07600 [Deltaproteobacteria bacterium RIFCSPLOWO2_02_FULL_50_16]